LSRIQTNNAFLARGDQVDFYSLYASPRGDAEQQKHFEDKVKGSNNLFPFQMKGVPPVELSGATYRLDDAKGNRMVIGVRITQANIPSEHCSLFVGESLNDPKLAGFIDPLRNYVVHGSPVEAMAAGRDFDVFKHCLFD
jgi:hypothetical protein